MEIVLFVLCCLYFYCELKTMNSMKTVHTYMSREGERMIFGVIIIHDKGKKVSMR